VPEPASSAASFRMKSARAAIVGRGSSSVTDVNLAVPHRELRRQSGEGDHRYAAGHSECRYAGHSGGIAAGAEAGHRHRQVGAERGVTQALASRSTLDLGALRSISVADGELMQKRTVKSLLPVMGNGFFYECRQAPRIRAKRTTGTS
jgi:hypothetical protein